MPAQAAPSSGGTYFRFGAGKAGRSPDHVSYLTRVSAVREGREGLLAYNLPEQVTGLAENYDELRDNLIAYAAVREDIEQRKGASWSKEPRTHYRVLASFERNVPSAQALAMTKEWLDKELPNARAFAVVHRDTEHTHVHVWIDARQMDDKKIQLPKEKFRSLDSSWNQIYCRELQLDPLVHARKKELARAGDRRGRGGDGERARRPSAAELAPRWERREIGVQEAREGQSREIGTFLEWVRATAKQDLLEATSWAELERRLDRHGLQIGPRGAGLNVGDGRRMLKASSIDREVSRGKLEERFGETLTDYRERLKQERVQEWKAQLVKDLQEMERQHWKRSDHATAVMDTGAARARLQALERAREGATRASTYFDQGLRAVYNDPVAARQSFDRAAAEMGAARAAELMKTQPQRYGALVTEEQRKLLGFVRVQDDSVARKIAVDVSARGLRAHQAGADAPGEWLIRRARGGLRGAQVREGIVRRSIRTAELQDRARIALAMRTLTPKQVQALGRWVTAPHIKTAQRLQQAVEKMAPDHVSQLAAWVRSPQLQLAASVKRAFTGLMQERGRDRGRD